MAKQWRYSVVLLLVTLVYFQNHFLFSNAEDVPSGTEETPVPVVKEENGVIILTKTNFDYVLRNANVHMVMIYADRCPKCHQVMPEFEKAAALLKAENSIVKFIKLEADTEYELAVAFGADTYPKLKASKAGKFWEYEDANEAQAIADYMRQVLSKDFQIPVEAVISLSADNFAAVVTGHQLMLVEFYAPWCQHCQRLAPLYERAAKELARRSPPILLAKVDLSLETNKPLAEKYDVHSFPELRVFRFGKDSPYNGEKNRVEDIVNYMETQRGDGSKEKSTIEEMNAAMSEDQVTIVGFFANPQSKQFTAYIDIANRVRDEYVLFHTFNESVASHFNAEVNTVVLFHAPRFHTPYEAKKYTFHVTETTEAENLQNFIYRNHNPLVGQLTQKTVNTRYLFRPLVLFFYTVDFSNEGVRHTQFWRQRIAKLAKDYAPMNTTFAIVNEEDFPEFTASFGIEESGEAVNVGILGKGSKRYLMPPQEEWDPEAIKHFISQYHQGKLKHHVKSQIAPTKLAAGIKIVVGNTFEKVVLDPTKDVLIQLHQPKCEMCKTIEPVYKQFASKYSKVKDLVVAKIDVSANDIPDEYKTKMLPAIFFVPKSNEAIKFEGSASALEALEAFVSTHATVDLGDLRVKKDEL